MNDTFFYASGDGEEFEEKDIPEIIKVYNNFGHVGLTCWAAKKRGYDPAIEYTEDSVYQNTWKNLYGDLKLEINPMLKDDPNYRWGTNSQLNLKAWKKINE